MLERIKYPTIIVDNFFNNLNILKEKLTLNFFIREINIQ